MVVVFCTSTLKIYAQDEMVKLDTNHHKKHYSWHFEKEKGGAVCTDGLEKLEIGIGVSKDLELSSVEILQLNFDGPSNTSGRIFVLGTQENGEHFLGGTLDATYRRFPVHLGYTFGLDQIHLNHDTTYATYIGPGLTFYPSDIKLFHHVFHIIRFGVYYEKLTKINALDDERKLGYGFSYNVFFQTQSFERKDNAGKIYLEGSFKKRGEESFTEFFIRYRDDRFAEGLINIGIKTDWKNSKYNSTALNIGLNLTRPNNAHL